MRKPKSLAQVSLPEGMVQLTSEECKRMIEHLEQCECCHSGPEEFSFFIQQMPSNAASKVNDALVNHLEKGGLRERFIERARAEGIQFSSEFAGRSDGRRWNAAYLVGPLRWVAAVSVITIIAAVLGYRASRPGPKHSLQAGRQPAETRVVTPQIQSGAGLEGKVAELQATIADSQKTISELRVQNSLMLARMDSLEKDLAASHFHNQGLEETRARLMDTNTELTSQNNKNVQLAAATQAKLEEVRAHGAEIEAEVVAEKAEVSTLSQQLKLQTAALDHERELLAAGRDVTDLMGARNLHVIDVHDADGRGKNKNSFGRIFYTEGRSLIFYAYDLDERRPFNTNYAFEVWGEKLGQPSSVRSLGILYTDDKEQKRWAMKVDDPQQLAEIDSVFVTLEPHEGDKRPLGQKILFAFLGGKANHF
jgi:uncharacterized coiled-coil protein SlyX